MTHIIMTYPGWTLICGMFLCFMCIIVIENVLVARYKYKIHECECKRQCGPSDEDPSDEDLLDEEDDD